MSTPDAVSDVPLHEATRSRYLSYALSVITARALPDVRDGLKPVQRRILYAMYNNLGLVPGGRYKKCAAVVGEVMAKYHPHGDSSIYDALVRMAQDFSLRNTLVDGQGNFGSLDGDPAAAMRYTECKLRPIAEELLSEIKKKTVDFRPTYDGQLFEPIVLPAQFPHLLVNGSEGIAVGMATRIPPHHLGEVIDAAVLLIDRPDATVADLCRHVKGPDFPTGGEILTSPAEIRQIYETGQGTIRLRAEYRTEKDGRHTLLILTSVPYGANKAKLVERIGEEVRNKKLPQVTDVRDESTEEVRVVLELKQGSSPDEVMAWLYKHTPLQTTWPINLTALIPTDRPEVATPARLDLKAILAYWLEFRKTTVRRRYEFDLAELLARIHILEGFAKIFDALDEAIAIIRASSGRRDAAERLIARFDLTDLQADAILELRLYRLAKLEIQGILDELASLRADAAVIERILASDAELWGRVRSELVEVKTAYADRRRTTVGAPVKELAYDEDAYVIKEDSYVVVTRDGWIKRQSSYTDLSKIRVREHDEIGWLFKAHTRSTVAFFGTSGTAYVVRVGDIPQTTGYGDPLTRHFALADGEKIAGAISMDARNLPAAAAVDLPDDQPPPPYGIAVTTDGRVLRFPLAMHEEPSNRTGRKYCRPDGAVFAVYAIEASEDLCLATRGGHALVFPTAEVPVLAGPGKGVTGIKLGDEDTLLVATLAKDPADGPTVTTPQKREVLVCFDDYAGPRAGKGKQIVKRGPLEPPPRRPEIRLAGDVPGGALPSVPPASVDDDGEEA